MEGNKDFQRKEAGDLLKVSFTPERKFVCVSYPGIVQNEDKAFATLGGIKAIQKTVQNPIKKLELKMRPEDIYCKPVFGTRTETTSLLLRVKRRRRKGTAPGEASVSDATETKNDTQEEWKADILGMVGCTFRFQSLCDFQYLPMERLDDGSYRDIHKDLALRKFTSLKQWLKRDDIPMFLQPVMFSRSDVPSEYVYRPAPKPRRAVERDPNQPTNLIGTARKKRTVFTLFAKFDDKEIPSTPLEGATQTLRSMVRVAGKEEEVRKLFEERPVWSKNAIMYHTKCTKDTLKCILPLMAYYFITGPWRSLWVKLGFDPRKDPKAKIYQVLDFRIRQRGAVDKLNIVGKRSIFQYNLPNRHRKQQRHVAKIHVSELEKAPDEPKKPYRQKHIEDISFIYKPDVLPPYRCMFYQMCDIQEEQCQQLIHLNDGMESECTEKDGWCIKGIGEKCRAIMYKHLKKLAHREEFPSLHGPAGTSAKASGDSDEDSDNEPMGEDLPSDDDMTEMETEMLDAV
ncbi:general transcription factor 3C polypeptide 5-like [Liolophura sinensis]|uniref:general transcription factor 3C polypeptide 5-like n=1 Tax=Liolophura sinensis TaxID=3198878 RepID=UPI0031580CAC